MENDNIELNDGVFKQEFMELCENYALKTVVDDIGLTRVVAEQKENE